jgi:uncharacterized protein HemX
MFAAIDWTGAGIIAAAFLGAGGVSSLFNLRKINQERKEIGAKADQIAADTLIKVNAELRLELERRDEMLGQRVGELRAEIAQRDKEIADLRVRYDALRSDFDALDVEFQKVMRKTGDSH